ncbi:hypothetical protein [Microbacterium sp.]|uniref:hypothetical protein n=1 Tax=Microbacterium sp. TaxID=51671 RepID=UPI003A887D92
MTARNRTPIVLSIVAAVLLVAVVIALTALFTRGPRAAESAPATSAPAAPAAPSSPASTPDAAPTPAGGAQIVLAADGFSVVDAAGATTFTHGWGDDAQPAVAALTDLFGAAPTEGFQSGDAHYYAYALYEWGGFTLADVSLGDGNKPRDEVPDPTWVAYTANTVADVEIVPEFGLSVGMSADAVASAVPDQESADRAQFGSDRQSFYQDGSRGLSVVVNLEGGAVTRIAYRYVATDL